MQLEKRKVRNHFTNLPFCKVIRMLEEQMRIYEKIYNAAKIQ